MDRHREVLRFINCLASAAPEALTAIFMNGGCYRLYEVLHLVFPEAQPWYDGNHVITRIGDYFYDINGEVSGDEHTLMSVMDMLRAESSGCDIKIESVEPYIWMTTEEMEAELDKLAND